MLPHPPSQGQSCAAPTCATTASSWSSTARSASSGSQNLIEPGYNKPKNHAAGREWVELMARLEGPAVAALEAVFAQDWYSETGEVIADAVDRPRSPRRTGAGRRRCQVVPSGPGFATENNLRLFTTLIYSAPAAGLADQPLLRPGRVPAVRRHDGRPARRRRRAVRQRGGRPVHGRPRPVLLLPGAARGRGADLPLPGAVRSCTPSTSRSTTTSRCSARATWTCARSRSTTRSR